MKLLILATLIACSSAAKLNRAYLPPNFAQTAGGSSEFLQTPLVSSSANGLTNQGNSYEGIVDANDGSRFVSGNIQNNAFENYEGPERPRAALERNAAILRQTNENNGETYSYAFETENGIVAEENGVATNGVEAQGGYSYTGDDGQVYSVRYTAGQNGFVAEGDHLPTPPPIPQEILLALEQNARDEAAGIYDDGSYSEGKYSSDNSAYQHTNNNNYNHNAAHGNLISDLNDDSVVVNSALNPEAFQRASRIGNVVGRQDQLSNGVTKAYLPPTRHEESEHIASGFSSSNRRPSFNARTGYNYYFKIEERNAAILRQTNEKNGETYSYTYETENGIVAEENGVATNGVEAQGGYSYTGDDGQVYSVRYTAGQNGFVAEGDHLPTPPPVPQEILLALQQSARDEAAGIYDDGSYSEGKYSSDNRAYQQTNYNNYYCNGVHGNIDSDLNDDSVVANSALNTEAFKIGSRIGNMVIRQDQLTNGVRKAYLPPTRQQQSGRIASGFDSSTRCPSLNARTGYNY